ncbi:MAG: DNA polymerase III subunit beta [Pseudomonadales bacterium]|jgi:DNA polymerase-3 subunit beta
MKFTVQRDALLKPLQQVASVVEKRQTLPILANVLLSAEGNSLSLTGTDLEVEMSGRVQIESCEAAGSVTVPAKKLLDICKALPDDQPIHFAEDDAKVVVRCGRSRFTLSTLPASEFPKVEAGEDGSKLVIAQSVLRRLIDATAFSMAQQDVRYYLNGMLFELTPTFIRTVATDGHRLAVATEPMSTGMSEESQCILPRKGVMELVRLVDHSDDTVELYLSASHIHMVSDQYSFISKLVDGKFPDYNRVLPKGGTNIVLGNRESLRSVFSRAAILSNEKYRGVRVSVKDNLMTVVANNPEQEEAEVQEEVNFDGDFIEIGFNVNYVLDVLAVLGSDEAKLIMADSTSSVLIQAGDSTDAQYVVMPMRL